MKLSEFITVLVNIKRETGDTDPNVFVAVYDEDGEPDDISVWPEDIHLDDNNMTLTIGWNDDRAIG